MSHSDADRYLILYSCSGKGTRYSASRFEGRDGGPCEWRWTRCEQLTIVVDGWALDRRPRAQAGDNSEDSGENAGKTGPVLLRPDACAERLSSVSLDDLAALGADGVIVDLDNTLCGYRQDEPAPADIAWVQAVIAAGIRVALLSNNYGERVARVARVLGVPAVAGALKPLPGGFLRALRLLGTARRRTVVVGDQVFTDVLGARLCGLRVILTHPLEPDDFAGTRILRMLERLVPGARRVPPPATHKIDPVKRADG